MNRRKGGEEERASRQEGEEDEVVEEEEDGGQGSQQRMGKLKWGKKRKRGRIKKEIESSRRSKRGRREGPRRVDTYTGLLIGG